MDRTTSESVSGARKANVGCNKKLLVAKGIVTSNKGITSSMLATRNKKLVTEACTCRTNGIRSH